VTAENLMDVMMKKIHKGSVVMTDGFPPYDVAGARFATHRVITRACITKWQNTIGIGISLSLTSAITLGRSAIPTARFWH
jgi:hypothetical protein